ncbi:MAG: HD domain-containing protein [Candidatus Sericytochromatia bacterium]|nr:HD domain-containing protein [Candidatus Tanganyikabacteria bacterium]
MAAQQEPRFDPSGRFKEALVFAADLHRAQTRKDTDIPYVSHLLAVAGLAMEYGADEDTAIAALLHDAVEDQGGAAIEARVRERFGDRVARIVRDCSDTAEEPKPPWRARKTDYLAHLPDVPPDSRLVSACDKLHNARCILADVRQDPAGAFAKFRGGREGTLWYYRSLAAIFRDLGSPVAEELGRVVAELDATAGPGG